MENAEFCENIRQYEEVMYAVAFSILRNDADCADAISESIVKAYMSREELKNKKVFKSWILKILHNTAMDMLRKKCDTVDIDDQYELSDERVTSEGLQTKIALRDAVDSLKQPYRTVVTLYYYSDMTVSEIANITCVTVPNVKKQLSRARDMLREILNKEDFF